MFGSRVEVGDSVSIGLITKSNCRRSFAQDEVTALKDLPRMMTRTRNGLRVLLVFIYLLSLSLVCTQNGIQILFCFAYFLFNSCSYIYLSFFVFYNKRRVNMVERIYCSILVCVRTIHIYTKNTPIFLKFPCRGGGGGTLFFFFFWSRNLEI